MQGTAVAFAERRQGELRQSGPIELKGNISREYVHVLGRGED
jgi:hypothetical protein